jgi:hypothetical protein
VALVEHSTERFDSVAGGERLDDSAAVIAVVDLVVVAVGAGAVGAAVRAAFLVKQVG